MPRSRLTSLLMDFHASQHATRKLLDLLSAWCYYPETVILSQSHRDEIAAARHQMWMLYGATISSLIGDVIRAHNKPAIEFLLANKFDGFPETALPNPNLPAIAAVYEPAATPKEYCHNVEFALSNSLLVNRIRRATDEVKNAIIQRLCTYLPATAAGANLLIVALTAIGKGQHIFYLYVFDQHTRAWKEHLADALFNHPIMHNRDLLYTPYGTNAELTLGPYAANNESYRNMIYIWKEVDRRLAIIRRVKAQQLWRILFWGAVVLEWRKREFLAAYYGPAGKGTAAAAARAITSLELLGTNAHKCPETLIHPPYNPAESSHECALFE